VIADFSKPLLQTIKKNYGLNLTPTTLLFNLDMFGIPHPEEEQLIVEFKAGFTAKSGAKETLERLSRKAQHYLLTSSTAIYAILRNFA